MAQEVASLFGKIGMDLSGAQKGLAQFDGMMNQASGRMAGFAQTAGTLAIGATAAVATGAAALGGIAINTAATFEQTISGIKAVSGATAGEMAGISALALKLGADTKYSASEAAQGIEELIKGGLSIADVMNGAADGMLNLAAAGGVDLASAAEISANAMAMFNLKGKDMGHVADQIAGAANASSLSVMDFKFSLAAAGAVAATSGQSFDDLAEAIAIMGKSGIKGQDAGTSLKAMLLNIQPTTKTARKAFEELGITVNGANNKFINANGSFKSMAEIAGVLQTATKDLTDAQKMQYLELMFGSDAMRAAAIFAKEGATGFDEMAKSMGKVTAASVAGERMNNLKGSIEQLKGSAETAAIAFGVSFLPMLKQVADGVTQMVNDALPAITAFGKSFAEWIPQAISSVQGVISGVKSAFAAGGWEGVAKVVSDWLAAEWAKIDWAAIWKAIDDFAGTIADWLATVDWARVGSDIGRFIGDAFEVALVWVGDLLTGGGGVESGVGKLIRTLATAIGNLAIGLGTELVNGFVSGVSGLAAKLSPAIKAELNKINIDVGPFHLSASGWALRIPNFADIPLSTSGIQQQMTARAIGGPVSAGSPYLVGERGPELFVPNRSGRIEPNAGATSIVCNFYGSTDANAARDGVLSAARSLGLGVA